jgi:hypothetical protein
MIQGSCHCGAIRWQFEGQPDGATACNCTVCRRYGVLWAYDYEDEGIKVSGRTQPYVRGKAIEFHFCPVCGCVAFGALSRKTKRGVAALPSTYVSPNPRLWHRYLSTTLRGLTNPKTWHATVDASLTIGSSASAGTVRSNRNVRPESTEDHV